MFLLAKHKPPMGLDTICYVEKQVAILLVSFQVQDDLAKLSDIQMYRNCITFCYILGPRAHPNTHRMVDQSSHLPLQRQFL